MVDEKEIKTRIVHKHDVAANWAKAINFIPKKGELIVYDPDDEYAYTRIKVGDGVSFVNNLPFLLEQEIESIENGAVFYDREQILSVEQWEQARKNIGIGTAKSVVIEPSYNGFFRENGTSNLTTTNYLNTSYLPITGYDRIEYNVFVIKDTNMATWALFDENKKHLASSGDINTEAYYTANPSGVIVTHGHMHNTIFVNDLLIKYPTATYIVFSTNITTGNEDAYKVLINQYGVDVGWGAMKQYAKFIIDDGYSAVRYDKEQELSSEQKLVARQNLGINSVSSNFNNRRYVEEFKTSSNSWDNAFADLIQYCIENNYVACAAGIYSLVNPIIIGDIDVDFEQADITNNTTTEACIILTGASQRIHKFGSVTAREGIGILINCETAPYAYNKLHAKLVRGYISALAIIPINTEETKTHHCWFNEYHVLRMRSSQIPLRMYVPDNSTILANESYFYLGIIEGYRDINPTKLVELTNVTRSNFYNLSIEQKVSDSTNCAAVELTNCHNIAFFNPRTAEPLNPIQFRFIGKSFYNFVDCEYCKYATIDSSQMQMSDFHFNVMRGSVITKNNGSSTNCNTLRVYKDMIVPVMLAPMVREIRANTEIHPNVMLNTYVVNNVGTHGIPTLYKWSAGNITINRRFIALLMPKLQIMKISDSVGNILDEEGNLIVEGSELALNKLYNINMISHEYAYSNDGEEVSDIYKYLTNIVLSIDPTVNGISSITIEEI